MGSKNVLTGFAIALLIYSGWRTWDYMSRYMLQDVGITESMIIGMFFLFVTELGFLFWLHIGQPQATTDRQESVASIMVYVDLAGSLVIGLADLLAHNQLYVFNFSAIDPILLLTPWILIAANLIGYTVYFSSDSQRQLDRANRQLLHKETEFEIAARMRALKELTQNQDAIAEKLAPHYVKDLTDRVTGRTSARFVREADKLANPVVKVTKDEKFLASGNGKAEEPVAIGENPTKR